MPAGQHWLTVTLEGLPEDVRAEADEITVATAQGRRPEHDAASCPPPRPVGATISTQRDEDDLLLRAGVPPQHLALYWQMLPEDGARAGTWFVDVAAGQIYGQWAVDGGEMAQRRVEQVRQPALALRGYAVVLAAPGQCWGRSTAGGIGLRVMR
jgi:hypothetical protein